MDSHKQCNRCSETKAFSEFYSRVGGKFGLRAECKNMLLGIS